MVMPALAGQMISLIDRSTIYAWLNNCTGSVFPCMLCHALNPTGRSGPISPESDRAIIWRK